MALSANDFVPLPHHRRPAGTASSEFNAAVVDCYLCDGKVRAGVIPIGEPQVCITCGIALLADRG